MPLRTGLGEPYASVVAYGVKGAYEPSDTQRTLGKIPRMSVRVTTVSVMTEQSSIGQRVREAMRLALPDAYDADVAAMVKMKPDAFSRSLSGGRAFSSLEIARLGDLLSEDVHWLITGEPDPYRAVFAARHDWDPETGQRHVPGRADDEKDLDAIRLAYTQASIWLDKNAPVPVKVDNVDRWTGAPNTAELSTDPAQVRALLGPDFIGSFADRLEEVFGVEVVRVDGLSTDYSFTLAGRRVIVLTAHGNWFRSNFSLAHELAHLALGHHNVTEKSDQAEDAANAFANELLLPAAEMRAVNWETIDEVTLARKIWQWGVSTQAVRYRLNNLRLPASVDVRTALDQITQRLLRRHSSATATPVTIPAGMTPTGVIFAVVDPISLRMKHASERRIPAHLIKHHLDGVAAGKINKGTLAWLLNTPVEELEVDEPAGAPEMSAEDLMAEFGLA